MRRTLTISVLALLAALPVWTDATARSPRSSASGAPERAPLGNADTLEPGLLDGADVLEPGLLDVDDDDLLAPGVQDKAASPPPRRPERHARSRVRGRPWNQNLLEPGLLSEADILEPGVLGERDVLEPGLLDVDDSLTPARPAPSRERPPGFIWDKDILEPGLLDVDLGA